MPNRPKAPLLVFCSYSHQDHSLRLELETQVSPLVRQHLITFWSDRRIAPGEAWEQTIDEKLETADIILLLISAYFVQSDYCYTRELQRAIQRNQLGEARVIPVFVRPCVWEGLEFAHLQGLPRDGKPISTCADREAAWTEVVRGLKAIAVEMQTEQLTRSPRIAVSAPTSQGKYDSSAYLRSLTAWRRTAFDQIGEIDLLARVGGRTVTLSEALADWSISPTNRVAILNGKPGSGKTYAFRSLAARLADQLSAGVAKNIPLFISAVRLRAAQPIQMIRDVVPEAADLIDEITRGQASVILIDGIDEVAPEAGRRLLDCLTELVRTTPDPIKVGISCRPPFRDVLIERFRRVSRHLISLEIQDLSDIQMRQSLDEPSLASSAIAANLRQPFALRLLGIQSKYATIRPASSLIDLHEQALDSLFQRSLVGMPDLQVISLEALYGILTEAAKSAFGSGSISLDRLRTTYIKGAQRAALINSLITMGVFALDTNEKLTFGHESLFDYFFARLLEHEMSAWDATHLAKSNLIYNYNVNRFLVPMLLRRSSAEFNATAQRVRQDLFTVAGTSVGNVTSGPVTRGHFKLFAECTGWRRTTGFGYWLEMAAPDGTTATSGEIHFDGATPLTSSERPEQPVSGVSWYDAQQFAWWVRAKIPSAQDCPPLPGTLLWTCDWHDESAALMRLISENTDHGPAANPDVRSSNIGFRLRIDAMGANHA